MTVRGPNLHAIPSNCPFCGESLDFRRKVTGEIVPYGVNFGLPHAEKCAKFAAALENDHEEESPEVTLVVKGDEVVATVLKGQDLEETLNTLQERVDSEKEV